MEKQPDVALIVRVAIEVIDPRGVERAGTADEAVNLVPSLQQELGQIRAVLAGDPGDQRAFQACSLFSASRARISAACSRYQATVRAKPSANGVPAKNPSFARAR